LCEKRQEQRQPGRWRKTVSSLGGTRKRKIAVRGDVGSRKGEILPGGKKILSRKKNSRAEGKRQSDRKISVFCMKETEERKSQ
jgi:hypothetical protein